MSHQQGCRKGGNELGYPHSEGTRRNAGFDDLSNLKKLLSSECGGPEGHLAILEIYRNNYRWNAVALPRGYTVVKVIDGN